MSDMREVEINAADIMRMIDEMAISNNMSEVVDTSFAVGLELATSLLDALDGKRIDDDDFDAIAQFAMSIAAANLVAGFLACTGDLRQIAANAESNPKVANILANNISGALNHLFEITRNSNGEVQ